MEEEKQGEEVDGPVVYSTTGIFRPVANPFRQYQFKNYSVQQLQTEIDSAEPTIQGELMQSLVLDPRKEVAAMRKQDASLDSAVEPEKISDLCDKAERFHKSFVQENYQSRRLAELNQTHVVLHYPAFRGQVVEVSPREKRQVTKARYPMEKEEIVRSRIAKLLHVKVADLEEKLQEVESALQKKWISGVDLRRRFRLSYYGLSLVKEYLESGVEQMQERFRRLGRWKRFTSEVEIQLLTWIRQSSRPLSFADVRRYYQELTGTSIPPTSLSSFLKGKHGIRLRKARYVPPRVDTQDSLL